MEPVQPFLTVAQFHLIEQQLRKLTNAYATTKDKDVIAAVHGIIDSELTSKVDLSQEQKVLIDNLFDVRDQSQAETYLNKVKKYVIPFREITEKQIKQLFKKEKKLKMPNIEQMDFHHICYVSWEDIGKHRKYIIVEKDDFKAIQGIVSPDEIKGICAICNQHANVSLFTTTVKGTGEGQFVKYSNYICTDVNTCNHHVTEQQRMIEFFERITTL